MHMIPWGQPVTVLKDRAGMIVSCWKLSWTERIKAVFTGKLYVKAPTQFVRPTLKEP